ncbi:hypothetical protein FHT01_002765 [Sphingomonas japonica]|uniref:Uncharacterized protein n=1 Tax=Sphingomonas japonica TaxID=511662 RepID=A0ABX0U3S1_9SPHN|nr:hypothetical protein [Sphingomonas japonica]
MGVAKPPVSCGRALCLTRNHGSGVIGIPRKTNYDFERREREKTKASESAKKAQAKAEKRAAGQGAPDTGGAVGA